MSNLNAREKRKLERLFGMSSGYVLDFSNATFERFILESVDIEIYDEKYDYSSGSKANRLRAFWDLEPNHIVGRLLTDIFEEWEEVTSGKYNYQTGAKEFPEIPENCRQIASRLLSDAPVAEIEAIKPNSDDKDFEALARSVKDYIARNEPETGLDRLHTFMVRYVRTLCREIGIEPDKKKALHATFGEYIKALKSSGYVESDMSFRILRSTTSILEAFNHVRNQQSQAHENSVLNRDEALYIFNAVASTVRFLESLNSKVAKEPEGDEFVF